MPFANGRGSNVDVSEKMGRRMIPEMRAVEWWDHVWSTDEIVSQLT